MKAEVEDDLIVKARAAFLVVGRKVIEQARRVHDGVVIWRDGRVVEISCDEAERLLAADERSRAGNV